MTKDYLPLLSHPNNNGEEDFEDASVAPKDEAKDATMALRTNIANAIDSTMALTNMNSEHKKSLNSLLDWFFTLRTMDEIDDIDSDMSQVFKIEPTQLIREGAETAEFLQENKRVVGKVKDSLHNIVQIMVNKYAEHTQEVTSKLRAQHKTKDNHMRDMAIQLREAVKNLEQVRMVPNSKVTGFRASPSESKHPHKFFCPPSPFSSFP